MKYHFFIFILFMGPLCVAWGQNQEPADPYLHVIEVATNSRFRDTIRTVQGIADYESELHIRLVRAEIEERILVMQGASRSDERLESLRRLNQLLDMQIDIQSRVNDLIRLDQAGDEKPFDKIQELSKLENTVFNMILADPVLTEKVLEREEDYLTRAAADPTATYITYTFEVLEEEATRLRQAFLTDLGLDQNTDSSLLVFFRLGAFVRNKQGGYPIHIENFDTYSPQEYRQSSIFSQPVSEEEKKALSENAEAGRRLKEELQTGQIRIQELFQAQPDPFPSQSTYQQLKELINRQTLAIGADSSARNILLQANLDLQNVTLTYSVIKDAYQTVTFGFTPGATPVRQLQTGLSNMQAFVYTAYRQYDQALRSYSQSVGSTSGRQANLEALSEVDVAFAEYRNKVKEDVSQLSNLLSKALGLLNPLKRNTLDSEAFTEQVKRFTIGNLPVEGIITVKTSGTRPGEDIVIRAVLQRGKGPQDRYFEEEVLSRRVIRLERVTPHIKMSGSLILANPYNPSMTSDTIALASNFQFAPSYTIFMSWGSRNSHFYNRFVGFGLGLGFSSPDFNLDGTPEFGVSVMGTVFQDIISAGWGWNFGVDTPYWYVGFNIPFTVGGIPNLGTSQPIP